MTIADVKNVLSVPGVTVHYDHAPVGTKVPFITYTCHADSNFFADDKVYQKISSMRAVLYSTKKDEKFCCKQIIIPYQYFSISTIRTACSL